MTDFFDIHADDYGLSPNSDKTILELLTEEKLDSISFMTNLSRFDSAVADFKRVLSKRNSPVLVSVHLNFVEGHCCASSRSVPDLVDENGFFSVSWEKLFLWSFNPLKRKSVRSQLTTEIIAQTERLVTSGIVQVGSLRFDSHMHTHMIPVVFDALCDVISQKSYGVSFIRDTHDPIRYYLGAFGLYPTYSPVNALKCMILNFFSVTKIRPVLRKLNLPCGLLCGVFFSGLMDKKRLERILPVFLSHAEKKHQKAEILFHPCLMSKEELSEEFNKDGINEFHVSANRLVEYESVKSLGGIC